MTVREYIQENWKNSIRKGEYKNLPYPYNSPSCEQTSDVGFENFFYWDTYFINLGLLCDGLEEQALNNIRNMIFLIGKYGYMPNVATEGGDNRSQFPLFIPMCHAYWQYTGDNEFVREAYPAMKKEYAFWMRRRMLPCGLNRYGNNTDAKTCGDFYRIITDTRLGKEEEKTEKDIEYLGSNLLSEAESGWDFTPRFHARAEHYAPIDLNSLLYENEKILAFFGELLGEKNAYEEAAVRRAELIRRHCTVNGDFYDYDSVRETCSPVISPALLMPYLCGLSDNAEKRYELYNACKRNTVFPPRKRPRNTANINGAIRISGRLSYVCRSWRATEWGQKAKQSGWRNNISIWLTAAGKIREVYGKSTIAFRAAKPPCTSTPNRKC